MNRLPLVLAALALALPAQEQPKEKFNVRACLPDDHRNVAVIDFVALRERAVWDELDVPPLNLAFAMIEKKAGFKLPDLDRLTMAIRFRDDPDDRRADRVLLLEGNKPLAVAASVEQQWGAATIGGHQVLRASEWSDDIFWQPRPEVQITGAASILEPVLNGKPNAGQPCPDIMSLTSAPANRLAWFVVDVAHPLGKKDVLGTLLPDVTWPEDDAPTFVCLQLLASGDADDPHVTVEVIVRHAKDGGGIAATEAAAKARLERLAQEPKLRIVRPVLQAAQVRRDRGDLFVSADLGRARAASSFATMLVPLLGLQAVETVEAVRAVPAQPVPAPAPDPEPKKQ